MSETTLNQPEHAQPSPLPDMRAFERLIGTWQIMGEAEGTVTYEWMEGGFFLMQRVDLEQFGQRTQGMEIIGHLQQFGEAPSEHIHSRYYDSMGNTFDYVYELNGNTLMIWSGEKGSPAYYAGTFSPDGRTLSGDWVYPGGGGYSSTATKTD